MQRPSIPPTYSNRKAMSDRIVAYYDAATPAQIAAGRNWYIEALEFASALAFEHGLDVRLTAGVLAVLSPNLSWTANKKAGSLLIALYSAGIRHVKPLGCAGYDANFEKAWRILLTRDSRSCTGTDVRSMTGSGRKVKCNGKHCGRCPIHGPKVAEFYRAIMGDTDCRTMDVWAIRASTIAMSRLANLRADDPRRDGLPKGRMAIMQSAYSDAAARRGESPSVMQAIVWLVIRTHWVRADGSRNGVEADFTLDDANLA